MQLHEILSSLTVIPIYIKVIEYSMLIAMVIFFMLALNTNSKSSTRASVAFMILCSVSLVVGFGTLIYESNSRRAAIEEAKISRVNDKIHIESKSEFLKSVDLDIVSEKDGYIKVEFKNKIYQIENLSKNQK